MVRKTARRTQSALDHATAWGIQPDYEDTEGQRREADAEAVAAVVRAMGYDPLTAPPADETRVRVVLPGEEVPVVGPHELTLEDGTSVKVAGTLPKDLPVGYHELRSRGKRPPAMIIRSPGPCYLAPAFRTWGWAVQLYAARSAKSWGIGDMADLRRLGTWAAEVGAGALLINPLTAVPPALPQTPSPYSPSSRRFRNPLYIAVEEVPGATAWAKDLGLETIAGDALALNAERRINRDQVYGLKMEALSRLWAHTRDAARRDAGFVAYCGEQGCGLDGYAAFCTLAERFGGDWRRWPAAYRDPASAAVQRFCDWYADRVLFHKWLQWLVDEQLARASAEIAIVQDLPLGVDPGGADAWHWQHVFAPGAAIGAPPDTFNMAGQNWALAPLAPRPLRAARFAPFIETLRASLRHAKGLRMDHVMGLFRLFWIPEGFPNARGVYVRYPSEELLAIVAVESHRAGAWIAGEDLGTVEPSVRERLAAAQMLSYRLLWFESRPPREYPRLSMATITTHDLPTVAGLWTEADFRAQQQIGVEPSRAEYDKIRTRFVAFSGVKAKATVEEACAKGYAALAEANSAVLVATLEDAMAVEERPNMPGTIHEWPNWSIALPRPIETLAKARLPKTIAAALSRRMPAGPRRGKV